MKEGAENVEKKIQAKVESLKTANENGKGEFFTVIILYFFYEVRIIS